SGGPRPAALALGMGKREWGMVERGNGEADSLFPIISGWGLAGADCLSDSRFPRGGWWGEEASPSPAYADFLESLPIENHRDLKIVNPRLDRVQLVIEKQVDHRCVGKGQGVGTLVHRGARAVVRGGARGGDQLVEGGILVEGDVPADAAVHAVQQWIEKILGVRVVGVPVLQHEIHVTLS